MKCLSFFLVLTLLFFNTNGQAKKKIEMLSDSEGGWYEGSVMLTAGDELKGLIKYNDRTGILSYQDGTQTKVFTPRSVAGFEFFDESLQKQRVFYTLETEDSKTNVKRPLFFEVLKEFKNFVVLLRVEAADAEQKVNRPGQYNPFTDDGGYTRTKLEVSQVETIFIMDDKGNIMPYVQVTNREDGKKSIITHKDDKTKTKVLDEDLLADYVTKPVYKELQDYAKENKLKFKRKEDLIKILDHYEELLKK